MSETTKHEIFVENARVVEVDFAVTAGRSSTTVSSADWSVVEGNVSVSNEGLVSAKATALVTAPDSNGKALVRVLATMANGEKVSEYLELTIIDPSLSGGGY